MFYNLKNGLFGETMVTTLAMFLLLSCTFWEEIRGDTGGSGCVDERHFVEQVFPMSAGSRQRLSCSLNASELMFLKSQTPPDLRWAKDCKPLLGDGPSRSAQVLLPNGTAFLEFQNLLPEDQGNYTCTVYLNSHPNVSFTVQLTLKEPACAQPPVFMASSMLMEQGAVLDSTVTLNCTALLPWDPQEAQCDSTLNWSKDGRQLSNLTLQSQNFSEWFLANSSQKVLSSLLMLTLREQADFGLYTCTVRNISAHFVVQEMRAVSHSAVVIAVMVIILVWGLVFLVVSKCHLNIKLWYKNTYGEFEINDGKLYDAYVSYVTSESDRKFVNFILKPHLENKQGYKLHLDDGNILPGLEPSAELLMNVSRCRRLVVVLSLAYLEQEWCTTNLREGLWRLLELSRKPILIIWETQKQHMNPDAVRVLQENRHRFTVLTWGARSMTPSSAFWKELLLVLPRKMAYCSPPMADPQTLLQDDRDPMLTMHPDYLDCHSDPDCDPAGDLGLRLPIYKALTSRAPTLPSAPTQLAQATEAKPFDIDVSDLGSRNYGARTDFYCLVTKEDI